MVLLNSRAFSSYETNIVNIETQVGYRGQYKGQDRYYESKFVFKMLKYLPDFPCFRDVSEWIRTEKSYSELLSFSE